MNEDALNENSAVLDRMAAQGDDLDQARDIEFAHLFADRRAANAFCDWAQEEGHIAVVEDREDARFDVIVRQRMVPELHQVTNMEKELAYAARDHDGKPDGWGCSAVPKLKP